MEEKKQIKVSLGTAVCVFIIIILLLVIAGMYVYYNYTPKNNDKNNNSTVISNKTEDNSKNINEINNIISNENKSINQKSENVLENWPNIDTSKIVNPGNGYTYSQKCMDGNSYTISKDKRSITIDYTNEKISGFDKNIESACIYFLGQGSLDFNVFLYEDGTVAYATGKEPGKIIEFSEISDIIKVAAITHTRKVEYENGEIGDFTESTIIAIDNNGKIYDLDLLR